MAFSKINTINTGHASYVEVQQKSSQSHVLRCVTDRDITATSSQYPFTDAYLTFNRNVQVREAFSSSTNADAWKDLLRIASCHFLSGSAPEHHFCLVAHKKFEFTKQQPNTVKVYPELSIAYYRGYNESTATHFAAIHYRTL